jgi:uncharacterized protein DUF4159
MKASAFIGLVLAAVTTASVAGVARSEPQRFGGRSQQALPGDYQGNTPYDGRFVFIRLRYNSGFGGGFGRRGGGPKWSHDYPRGEMHFSKILNEITYVRAREDGSNILGLDDPELFKYPIAYIIEVGWWTPTDREAAALRAYLAKGGFVIVDDFKTPNFYGGGGWDLFEANMRRVLPGIRFFEMKETHPIFHSFFEIHTLRNFPQAYNAGEPIFRGVYEDNDPAKRLQMIVNYNTDISQYWEWSGRGLRPFDETNEAYKLGVNYIMYGMMH